VLILATIEVAVLILTGMHAFTVMDTSISYAVLAFEGYNLIFLIEVKSEGLVIPAPAVTVKVFEAGVEIFTVPIPKLT
jgi:hypothetical protein